MRSVIRKDTGCMQLKDILIEGKMNKKVKEKLKEALAVCESENRSEEYTLQFLQDYARVSFDAAVDYFNNNASPEK